MDVAIVTVGDEILAGDTSNTNAERLAARLTEQGANVVRMLTIPDDDALISEVVADWGAEFDAVLVGGGLGGTHDDVTMDAVADAFGRELVLEDAVRGDLIEQLADYRGVDPADLDPEEIDLDLEAWGATPGGARPLLNPEGLCPGCVIENVYVLPGPPAEFEAMFELVAAEFGGDSVSESLETTAPEGSLTAVLAEFREAFDLVVGSYPSTEGRNRLKVTGTDECRVAEGIDWLRDRVPTDGSADDDS
ncbi:MULTISPECIES: competence/damage-inducible protein A [Halolamina]|uniref:Molybdenum cofactor synthesis domain-containing protein n=1 Tax=Halolamina pelagica TaxID=699431 RepID=A0A1I5R8E3_9EURY|nr:MULTISPECIES: molybdopterin-binding protein [Halolamina]NHX35737.1 competence/damage-inducible protein A [Halolamina sp. R1-12]SFP54812.1 molybdenum cofactor synthesis domain-containing protein [Halolamina pelagica]